MPVDPVALKIVVGYRQPTVVHPAMVCQIDFQPVQYPNPAQGEIIGEGVVNRDSRKSPRSVQ